MSTEKASPISIVSARRRSWLFTPATRPERFEKASAVGADVLIVDLEDSVSLAQKYAARENVRAFLAMETPRNTRPLLAIRVNNSFTSLGFEDLNALAECVSKPDFILLPKIESPEQVIAAHSLLSKYGKVPELVPIIESATGLRKALNIAMASPSVTALMFGAGDFASDVRAQPDSLALQLARCHVAMACATASIKAIDAPCFALHDADLLRFDLNFAGKNGFQGKAAIHPSHIDAINTYFTPSKERIDWAKRVIEASERGAGVVDGRMVDEAIAREAREALSAL